MTDETPTPDETGAPRGPASFSSLVLPTVVLAGLAGLLTLQMIGEPAAAIGAALGAGLFTFVLWGRFVLAATGSPVGGALGTGAIALLAAYVGAALAGASSSHPIDGAEAAVALLFSLWIVTPIFLAAAVGLAVVTTRSRRREP